jgi:hypothetical protein
LAESAEDSGEVELVDEDKFRPLYNACPMAYTPVLRLSKSTGKRVLHVMKWGED